MDSALTAINVSQTLRLDSYLVGALSAVNHKDTRAEHKLHSVSKLFISQLTISPVMLFQPIHIPRALNTGTCIPQGNLFYLAGLHKNQCYPQVTQEKLGRGFGKNAGEWTGRVEISKEELPGGRRSMHGYIQTCSRF